MKFVNPALPAAPMFMSDEERDNLCREYIRLTCDVIGPAAKDRSITDEMVYAAQDRQNTILKNLKAGHPGYPYSSIFEMIFSGKYR